MEEISARDRYQAFRKDRVTDEETIQHLPELIDPPLHKEIMRNPYSIEATRVIQEKAGLQNDSDVHRAFALAEPKGGYEVYFNNLTKREKVAAIYKEIDDSAKITMRLSQYIEQYAQSFWEMQAEEAYKKLCEVAFEMTDYDAIQENFSQEQRRSFRLAIVNFIDAIPKLKEYRDRFIADPRKTANEILKEDLQGDVEIESLPFGFVVYLEEEDYMYIEGVQDPALIPSNGTTLFQEYIPEGLRGRVIVVNRGGNTTSVKTDEEVERTRKHEIKHVIFSQFHETGEDFGPSNTFEVFDNLSSLEAHQEYAERLYTYHLQHLKDEVIAYATGENYMRRLSSLGGDKFHSHMQAVREKLQNIGNLSLESKRKIYDVYHIKFCDYLMQAREFQLVATQLYQSADTMQGDLSSAKAEALLLNTPIENIYMLGKYFGVKRKYVPLRNEVLKEKIAKKFLKNLDQLIVAEEKQDSDAYDLFNISQALYLENTLPAFIKIINNVSEDYMIIESIDAIRNILELKNGTVGDDERTNIRLALQHALQTHADDSTDGVHKRAERLLLDLDTVYSFGGVTFEEFKEKEMAVGV